VAIFDHTKRKPYRMYKTDAVTSIAWSNTGDLLFAGMRNQIDCFVKVLSYNVM